MKKIILISLFVFMSFSLAQDSYPFFSDPLKQLEFEEKRIYVTEESGERTILSGGGSYTELANPLGYLLLDEDPDYIAKTLPIKTDFEYWYDFKIVRNNINITELEFMSIIGLSDKAAVIRENFEKEMSDYYITQEGENVTKISRKGILGNDTPKTIFYLGVYIGALFVAGDTNDCGYFGNGPCYDYGGPLAIMLLAIPAYIINAVITIDEEYTEFEYSYPHLKDTPQPVLKQTLSSHQIKSLAESYNMQVYNSIKSDK